MLTFSADSTKALSVYEAVCEQHHLQSVPKAN